VTKRGNFPARVQVRREQAEERQVKRNERGDAGQLDKLNHLGYAAVKERRRLTK